MDTYPDFSSLEKYHTQGIDYQIEFRNGASGITVMAPHGGGIEPGTADIARETAYPFHTFWAFRGIRPRGNGVLHITSTRFDEPSALKTAGGSQTVMTIHGCAERIPLVYLGGRDENLKRRILNALQGADFRVAPVTAANLRGEHPRNLCNRCISRQGIQLEISFGLRKHMFRWYNRPGAKEKTKTFFSFITALRSAIAPSGPEVSHEKKTAHF